MKTKKLTNKEVKKLKAYMLGLRWDAIAKNTKADDQPGFLVQVE